MARYRFTRSGPVARPVKVTNLEILRRSTSFSSDNRQSPSPTIKRWAGAVFMALAKALIRTSILFSRSTRPMKPTIGISWGIWYFFMVVELGFLG